MAMIVALGSGFGLLSASALWLLSLLAFSSGGSTTPSNYLGFMIVFSIPTLFLTSLIVAISCVRAPTAKRLAMAAGLGLTALAIPMVVMGFLQFGPHRPAQLCVNSAYLDSAGRYDAKRTPKAGSGKMICRDLPS